jgi:hypothetical protein
MLLYLLKSCVCLVVFYGFYKLLLEKESVHAFKRYYLLGALIVSFCIPFITFTEYVLVPKEIIHSEIYPVISNEFSPTIETPKTNYIPIILWSVYLLGVFAFTYKFIRNLSKLVLKIKRNPKIRTNNFTKVLLKNLVVPHTFFTFIFLNKHKFETHQIPKEVLLHEETHAKQMHSLDVLFIELLQILFWFNPLIYFIKQSIKLNHEFLADQAVINKGVTPSIYQEILLAFSSNASEPQLANAVNYSSIKKRFTVMKTHTSKQAIWFRSFILLPLLAVLIYGFSQKVLVEKNQNFDTSQLKEIPLLEEGKGVSEDILKEYNDFTNEFNQTRKIDYDKHLRFTTIYKMMTKEQRQLVNNPHFQWFNLSKINTTPRHPTQAEFDSWKNSKDLVFSIDKKVIKTKDLNNYTPQDIYSYSNKFFSPEKGSYESTHYILQTKKGFQQQNQDIRIRVYKKLLSTYLIEAENSDKTELQIIKTQLNKLYISFNKEEIQKYNIKKPFDRKRTIIQQQATPKEIAEYNKLAKHINNQIKNKGIVKLKEITRLNHLYSLMSKSQKKRVDPYPDLSLLPPPPTMDTISTYKSLTKRTKFIPNNRKNNIQYLKVLFNKMSDSQKEKVESPNSVSKYIAKLDNLPAAQIEKANKVLNKIKTKAQSEGREFFTATEYNELEELYDSMLSETK